MKYTHLPAWRQQLWTGLHFPFHLSLTVFMTAFTQFIIWTKITNAALDIDAGDIFNMESWPTATSEDVYNDVYSFTTNFFKSYPPTWSEAWTTVDVAVANITEIPDDFWGTYYDTLYSGDYSQLDYDATLSFETSLAAILSTMANALFQTFGIDVNEELREATPQDETGSDILNGEFQAENFLEIWERYELIVSIPPLFTIKCINITADPSKQFAFGYIAAGVVLFLMTLLTIATHIAPWRPWSIIRTIIMVLISIGLGSVSAIYYNNSHKQNYLNSPWLVPTITLGWLMVLVLAHAHNFPDPRKGRKEGGNAIFNWPKVYAAVEGKGFKRRTYEPAGDGTVVMMEERFEPQREQHGTGNERRLPRRDSFYDQVGHDGSGYGGYRGQAQGLGFQQSTAYEPSYDLYGQQAWSGQGYR